MLLDVTVLEEQKTIVALSRPLLKDCHKFDYMQWSNAKKLYLF
jgi:hypothetical protein